jgi:hypothetical protein
MPTHRDFAHAPPRRRYRGRLRDLRRRLYTEALLDPRSHASWCVVPNGALISMTAMPRAPLQVRIARSGPCSDPQAWEREIDTFAKHLDLTEWTRRPDPSAAGHAILLEEPSPLLAAHGDFP